MRRKALMDLLPPENRPGEKKEKRIATPERSLVGISGKGKGSQFQDGLTLSKT